MLVTAEALTERWDGRTSTWQMAVDSLGDQSTWSTPGGGSVTPLGTTLWDPAESDSILIEVDSATVAAWADSLDLSRGIRLSTPAPGVRLEVNSARLWLDALPSLRPDTIIDVLATTQNLTFLYDPLPDPPPDGLRVGGLDALLDIGDPCPACEAHRADLESAAVDRYERELDARQAALEDWADRTDYGLGS